MSLDMPPRPDPKSAQTRTDLLGTASTSKAVVSSTKTVVTTATVKAAPATSKTVNSTSNGRPILSTDPAPKTSTSGDRDPVSSVSSKTVAPLPKSTLAAPAPKPKDPPAPPSEPVQPTSIPTRVDPDKHIAKRLKSQKIAERRRSRALEQAGLIGGMTPGDREEKEKRVREEIDAVYKRGLGKATALEVEVSFAHRPWD